MIFNSGFVISISQELYFLHDGIFNAQQCELGLKLWLYFDKYSRISQLISLILVGVFDVCKVY